MGSLQTETLEALLEGRELGQKADLKTALTSLSAELNTRTQVSSQASYDFVSTTLRLIAKVKGSTCSDIRLRCLSICVSYFYSEGFQAKALEASRCMCSLATIVKDKDWTRKAF